MVTDVSTFVNMCHTVGMDCSAAPERCLPTGYTPSTSPKSVEDIAALLKILGEPARLTILEIVAAANGDAVCACVFPDALGISQPTASHHLRKLTDAGLLSREQHGKWAYFRLVPDGYQRVRAFLDPLLARETVGLNAGS